MLLSILMQTMGQARTRGKHVQRLVARWIKYFASLLPQLRKSEACGNVWPANSRFSRQQRSLYHTNMANPHHHKFWRVTYSSAGNHHGHLTL